MVDFRTRMSVWRGGVDIIFVDRDGWIIFLEVGFRRVRTHLNCNQYRLGIQYPFSMYLIYISYTFFGIQYCKPPK
jgi:hypothetical protein